MDGDNASSSDTSAIFDELVFKRELNEVYLLLDFISGRQDKHLSELDGKIKSKDDKFMSAAQIVEEICLIRYPPTTTPMSKAESAGFLLCVKDLLNSIAFPARGLTIAFTCLFNENRPEFFRGTRRYLRSLFRVPEDQSNSGKERPEDPSRISVAKLAYPNLVVGARRFRRLKSIISWTLVAITLIGALLLWEVAYGVQVVSRFEENKRNETSITEDFYNKRNKDFVAAQAKQPSSIQVFCDDKQQKIDDGEILQLCNQYAYMHSLLQNAIADVHAYSSGLFFTSTTRFFPVHSFMQERGNNYIGLQEDTQTVSIVLSTWGNYVLPMIFGLLGTLAATVRDIQGRLTESILCPRDMTLSFIRLPLGLLAGLCVGLFFDPASVAIKIGGGMGALTVSASGIAFLAGYGSEGFFRLIDLLIIRIFALDSDTKRSATK